MYRRCLLFPLKATTTNCIVCVFAFGIMACGNEIDKSSSHQEQEKTPSFSSGMAEVFGATSQKPGDPPFVNIGDKITKGQILCIIEAMKIFNEIESEVTGIVKDICVENGKPVEFDQLILKISPE